MSQLNSITNYFFAKAPKRASEEPEKLPTGGQEDSHALLLRATAKRKNAEEEAVFRQRADCAKTQPKRLCGVDGAAGGAQTGPLGTAGVFFRRYISEPTPSPSECSSQSDAVSDTSLD